MAKLTLLGQVELESPDGSSIDAVLSHPKSLALLAYLAASGPSMQRRDRMVGVFWPELTEARARRNLRNRIHRARDPRVHVRDPGPVTERATG